MPGVSLLAPPLAGALLGMRWSRFLALTTAGAALYGVVVIGAGILLRNQIDWALREMHALGWHLLVVAAVTLAAYIAWRLWRRRVARAPNILRISADELQGLIDAGERPLIVDVRGPTTQQIDPRRIPDAIAIAPDTIEAGRDELPRDRKIVLYCGCPNEASAAKAAQLLLGRGYVWVRPLTGGLEAWGSSGTE